MPYDRPVVGYGGKTINTLRLWAAAAPDYFDFQRFSHGDFVGALAETLGAESLTRVLYPDDSTTEGKGFASCRSISSSPVRWRTCFVDSARPTRQLGRAARKGAIQLNDTHPSMAVPELMRILLDDAKLGWDRRGHHAANACVHQPHAAPEALERWPVAWFELMPAAATSDHLRDNRRWSIRCDSGSGAMTVACGA
jgi:starch phosphorylase